jgi:hypothetical protein
MYVSPYKRKKRGRREREREIDSWVVTATFGFMAMGHTNRLIPEANSEHPEGYEEDPRGS